MPELSIIIPARNESATIEALLDGITDACAGFDHEVIVVDDASDDGMDALLRARIIAGGNGGRLRLLRLDHHGGKSAAIHSGAQAARGAIIVTLDGDGQNPPEELPRLVAPLLAPGAEAIGIVAGQRIGRKDTLSKRLASRFANRLRSRLLRDGTRDTACGFKAMRREAFLALPYFDNMHRYLPALFVRDGWQVAHVDVRDLPRVAGRSHYSNLERGLVGISDLAGVAWLLRRRKKATAQEVTAEREAQ